jgi:methyl-accepting chemotaxis protein
MTNMFAKMKIGQRLALTLGAGVIAAVAATTSSNLWLSSRMMDQAAEQQLALLAKFVEGRIAAESQRAVIVAQALAGNTAVAQAFAARDRDALARMLVPGFASLKAEHGVDQMHFHTPEAVSFLRVNSPTKFGDDLTTFRKAVVVVNSTRKPAFGLEMGTSGLGIRGIVPVMYDGKHIGSVEVGLTFGETMFQRFKQSSGADVAFFLKTDKGFESYASTFAAPPFFTPAQFAAAMDGASPVMQTTLDGIERAVQLSPVRDFGGTAIGVHVLALDRTAFIAAVDTARNWSMAIGAVMLILTIMAAWFMHHNIAVPIRRIGDVLMALARGDKNVDIPYTERADEVGGNARAAQAFHANIVRVERLEGERRDAEAAMAAERVEAEQRAVLEREAAAEQHEAAGKNAMHRVLREFESAVGSIIDQVSSSATELEATAETLATTARSTQDLSNNVASSSEEASTNVEAVASASEELTASVQEIRTQVQASSDIAARAVAQARETDQRVGELSKAAARIGDVVKLITAIAEQTNLLALNATIEAARAGDAGKGFAVVAQEVKALAAQTAKATGEIGSQIAGIQTATGESVTAIKEIGGTIAHISQIAAAIAQAVDQQGIATTEIARNVHEAARGTTCVSGSIADVDRHAVETGAAATQMLSAAQSLSQDSNHLKSEMENFLVQIRTGLGNRRKREDPSYHGPERRHADEAA